MNQTDFLLKCADYPAHDYECLDCNVKIYGVIADLKTCSSCKSVNITYMGVPQGKGDWKQGRLRRMQDSRRTRRTCS